jgi:hypothetical protein
VDDYGSYWGSDYDAYNDFGGGSYDYGTPSYDFGDFGSYDYGSPSFGFQSPATSYDYSSWLAPYVDSTPSYSQGATDPFGGVGGGGYSQGALGIPSGSMNVTAPSGQGGGLLDALLKPQTLLGLGGGLASLIGTLSAGGQTGSQGPQMTTAQKAALGQGQQFLSPFASGTSPLQQQQASLLQAIMSGQGLAQPYAQAVERAYEPALGDLYTRAAEMGRRRGFHDAPATSPPGGAVLGPGLAALQGQQAKSKLDLMTMLPQLYNQPVQSQGQFANAFLGAAQNPAMMQQTASQPLGAQLGQQIGGTLAGIGGGIQQAEQQQQQAAQYQSLLEALSGRQPSSMSGATY